MINCRLKDNIEQLGEALSGIVVAICVATPLSQFFFGSL